MKRQQDETITSRVYSYGCVPARIAPVRNEEGALAQMRLGQRLWNTLTAIERTARERYRRIMHDAAQDHINEITAKIKALRDEMKERRKASRSRVDVSDLTALVDPLRAELAELIATRRDTSAARHAARKRDLDALSEQQRKRVTRARQAAGRMGLFWGSYNDIVQRADAAAKLAKSSGGELRFRGFRGEGTLTAQIMGGASAEACVARQHTFFQIDASTPGQRWRYARMRIGSQVDRSPVWLEIPIVYHRDIPPGASIRSVSMTRRVMLDKPSWQLNVTVNLPRAQARTTGAAVAIDLGWRIMPHGVRVGYWAASDGSRGEVILPSSDIAQWGKIAEMRSASDRMRDEYIPALHSWLTAQALPESWQEKTAYLLRWRSADRLAALVRWWADNRLPGDQEMFDIFAKRGERDPALNGWRSRYMHLRNYWTNLQRDLTGRTRERFRCFAANLVRRGYAELVLESFDLRPMAETEDPRGRAANHYRQIASPSVLRAAVVNACKREGVTVHEVDAAYSTRRCHLCGCLEEWNQAESATHRCVQCRELWDQDYNACRNLLVDSASGGAPATGAPQVFSGLGVGVQGDLGTAREGDAIRL